MKRVPYIFLCLKSLIWFFFSADRGHDLFARRRATGGKRTILISHPKSSPSSDLRFRVSFARFSVFGSSMPALLCSPAYRSPTSFQSSCIWYVPPRIPSSPPGVPSCHGLSLALHESFKLTHESNARDEECLANQRRPLVPK